MAIDKFIEKVCVQPAILWEYQGNDVTGQPSFAAPTQIHVRWEEKSEVMMDDEGHEFVSRAEILVTEDYSMKDYIALGEVDSNTASNPKEYTGAYMVRSFQKIPMIFSTSIFVRKVYL